MRKVIAVLVISAAVVATLIASCSQGEKRISLRFKYEPGLKLTYQQVSKRQYQVTEADTLVENDASEYLVDIDVEVIRFVDDTTAEIIEKGTWQYERPNKEDTTKIDTVYRTTETRLQASPSGKIIDVEFINKREPSSITYVKNYYEQGVPIFPTGEKPVGYSWTQTTKVMLPDEVMEASMTYTLKSEARQTGYDCAVIEYEGNMLLPVVPNPSDSVPRSGIDRVSITGVMYFAHKEGFVVDQKENWTIDGERQFEKKGEAHHYKIASDYVVTYSLVKREGGN